MTIRGVIFDLDGTLADTVPVCLAAFRRTFLHFTGRRYGDAELKALFTPTEEGIIQRVLPDRCAEAFAMFVREYEAAHSACNAPFAGIPEVLCEIRRRGARMAIVTGKGRTTADISLDRIGLSGFFDTILTGGEDGSVKAERIVELSTRWNIEPPGLAYVGDAARDVTEARSVNAVPLAAGWAESTDVAALEQARPSALFRTTADMLAWVHSELNPGHS